MLMLHATQIREFSRAAGKLQCSIQAIQGMVGRRAGTSLSLEVLAEQEAWAADQPMPTVEKIQDAINTTMATPHTTPEEWREMTSVHDGSVKWADIQNYLTFRQVFLPLEAAWGHPCPARRKYFPTGSCLGAPLFGKTR